MSWYDDHGVLHKGRKMGSGEAHQRFAQNTIYDPVNGCWLWIGKLNHEGYARMWSRSPFTFKKHQTGHLYSYERFVGQIPDGFQVDHLCRVRNCVAPFHLEAVTQRVNLLRGNTFQARNAAKTHCDDGHEFNEENTHIREDGSRACRACCRERAAGYRAAAGGDPLWLRVKQDPEALEKMRAYKRNWAQQKRARRRTA